MPTIEEMKRLILSAVDKRKEEWITLLSRVVQFNTDNPPSDTRGLVSFLSGYLNEKGLPAVTVMPAEPYSNLLTYLGHEKAKPHLTLNGHLDQFPADDPELWTHPPYSGAVEDGKIYGRGVSDMKGGTTASLVALVLLHELGVPLNGRLSFMGVSDEETGGRLGTQWILKHHPEYVGDACLNGEPYAPDVVGIGERGAFRIVLRIEGEPMHGSLSAGDNAIIKMGEALIALRPILKEETDVPPELKEVIEAEKKYTRSPQDVGRQWMLDHPSYNVGMIRGGTKINVVPRYCEAELDIRLPVGFKKERMEALIRKLLRDAGREDVQLIPFLDTHIPGIGGPPEPRIQNATWTPMHERLVQIVRNNATSLIGKKPIFFIGMGATDGRFFRMQGIPTVIYGPRPVNMGGIDEHIFVDEYLTVIKVHACSIVDYLGLKE